MFFTLFLRTFILLRELEYVVGTSVVGSGAKGDQRCARGFAVLQYTRKHGLVRERRVCVTSREATGEAAWAPLLRLEREAGVTADAARAASGGRMFEGQEEDSQEEHDVLRTYIEIYDDNFDYDFQTIVDYIVLL